MKNLFLCLTLSLFAAASVLADTTPTTASADKKTAAKACCQKDACCASKSACCKGMPTKKSVLMSPKAMAEAGK